MGDNHVCSFCNEKLQGKQHIKIVFENWPVEEEVIYRRKGKEIKKTRKETKEVITAIGMECVRNPERWEDFDIDPSKVADFFEDLRFVGKNPFFRAILTKDGPICLSTAKCPHYTPLPQYLSGHSIPSTIDGMCQHIGRGQFEVHHLDMLYCQIGHSGIELVRQPFRDLFLQGNVKNWATSLRQLWELTSSGRKTTLFLSAYYFFWLFSGWFVPYFIMWIASFPILGVFKLGQRLKWKAFSSKKFELAAPPRLP